MNPAELAGSPDLDASWAGGPARGACAGRPRLSMPSLKDTQKQTLVLSSTADQHAPHLDVDHNVVSLAQLAHRLLAPLGACGRRGVTQVDQHVLSLFSAREPSSPARVAAPLAEACWVASLVAAASWH